MTVNHGSTFLDQMAEFDARAGRPGFDPTRIEGFGPGNPGAPPLPEPADTPSAKDLYGEPIEVPDVPRETSVQVSPLIAVGTAVRTLGVPASGISAFPIPKEAELWIWDENASFRGRTVALSESERAQVKKVVLKAIRRSIDEQYQEIAGTPMRTRPASPAASPPSRKKAPRGSRSATAGSVSPPSAG